MGNKYKIYKYELNRNKCKTAKKAKIVYADFLMTFQNIFKVGVNVIQLFGSIIRTGS